MRMWLVKPELMCRKHLLGEHVECHMFKGALIRNKNIKGYIENGLLDATKLKKRHNELVREMKRRGYNHKSPLDVKNIKLIKGNINIDKNLKELKKRCKECRIKNE